MPDKFSIKMLFGLHEICAPWRPMQHEPHLFEGAQDGGAHPPCVMTITEQPNVGFNVLTVVFLNGPLTRAA
jgi:hypothetical protein